MLEGRETQSLTNSVQNETFKGHQNRFVPFLNCLFRRRAVTKNKKGEERGSEKDEGSRKRLLPHDLGGEGSADRRTIEKVNKSNWAVLSSAEG